MSALRLQPDGWLPPGRHSAHTRCGWSSTHHDEWFTYELEIQDDVWRGRNVTRMRMTVNGDELYQFLDFDQQFKEGHFAFQQHDPGSKVQIRKVEVMEIPAKAP